MTDLRESVVAILDSNGAIVGTGFLASAQLLLTCAHVVKVSGGGSGSVVPVRFHLTGDLRQATVLPDHWRAPQLDDVAVLRLDGTLPPNVAPVQLGAAQACDGHTFRAFGYPPVGAVEGIWATGQIEGLVQEQGRALIQLTSSNLAQGISGGPVLDENTGRVIGLVTAVVHPDATTKHHDTGFATPTETLWQVCPELAVPIVPPVNPFFFGGAVPPQLFVGRQSTLNLIKMRLGGPALQSVSIVGERRMGKSSLLRYVTERAGDLFNPRPVVIYLDLMKGYCHTRAGFTRALHRRLSDVLGRQPWPESEHAAPETLSFAFENLSEDGVRIILCLDEIEQLTRRRQEFDPVLEELRAAGQMGQVGMLTASKYPLADICQHDGLISPFYNIFLEEVLGLLPAAEWQAFVRERMVIDAATLNTVESLAGGHPCFIQIVAWRLWETRHGSGHADWQAQALTDLERHWLDQWQHLSAPEQAALRVTVGLAGPAPANHLLAALTRRGLLHNGQPFCAAYGEWLKKVG